MARNGDSSSGGGCIGWFVLLIVVAAIVAATISLAALVDPFDWMPSVGEIWADCEGDCDLAHRFPGFWWHVLANLAYAAVASAAAIRFGRTVARLRHTRLARYDSAAAMDEFRAAHSAWVGSGQLLGTLALISIGASIA